MKGGNIMIDDQEKRRKAMELVLKIGRDISLHQKDPTDKEMIKDVDTPIVITKIINNQYVDPIAIFALTELFSAIDERIEELIKLLDSEKEAHKKTYSRLLELV